MLRLAPLKKESDRATTFFVALLLAPAPAVGPHQEVQWRAATGGWQIVLHPAIMAPTSPRVRPQVCRGRFVMHSKLCRAVAAGILAAALAPSAGAQDPLRPPGDDADRPIQ